MLSPACVLPGRQEGFSRIICHKNSTILFPLKIFFRKNAEIDLRNYKSICQRRPQFFKQIKC